MLKIQLSQPVHFLPQDLQLELRRATPRHHLIIRITHLLVQSVKTNGLRTLNGFVILQLLHDDKLRWLKDEKSLGGPVPHGRLLCVSPGTNLVAVHRLPELFCLLQVAHYTD